MSLSRKAAQGLCLPCLPCLLSFLCLLFSTIPGGPPSNSRRVVKQTTNRTRRTTP